MESDNKTFEQLKTLVDQARREGSWLVLAGHEINTSRAHTTYMHVLEELLKYINNSENGVWVGTAGEIVSYIKTKR
jgi:hypothetical protein